VEAVVARWPEGRCSKAFCSSRRAADADGERLEVVRGMGDPSARFLGRPRSMIEAPPSDSWRRWPCEAPLGYCLCGASETPREWPEAMGDGPAIGGVGVMAPARELKGWGEERPSGMEALGTAELGVFETEVEAVEADRRVVLDADMGV
jgi:hypothetical protein